jgi:uncharacterized membrane protein
MPYEWTAPDTLPRRLSLWPHRSLLRKDFVHFMGATAALAALPIITMLGTPILWMLLMPFAGMFALLWWALRRSDKDGEIVEELTLTPDHAHLIRHNPRGNKQEWEANPYWTSVHLHPKGGPVENYLTLRGNGREVEIGAFLSPEERVALYDDLQGALAKLPR